MDRLVEIVLAEWRVIKGAPIAFGAAILVSAIVIWRVMEWGYSKQLENETSAKDLLQDRVVDYERKLKVSAPEEAEKKFKALQDEIAQLKDTTPRLQIVDRAWERQEDGTWAYIIKFHSATKLTPNGLLLSFDAPDIKDLKVRAHNEVQTNAGWVERGHDISVYIQKPFGYYTLHLQLKEKTEVTFTWAYDGFPGGSDVSR